MAAPGASAAVPSGNLVVNPGAEQGTAVTNNQAQAPPPGWFADQAITQVVYGSPGGFPAAPATGARAFFAGGPGTNAVVAISMFQVVDVSAAATQIDRGTVRATLSALLGGFSTQTDDARASVQFASSNQEAANVGPPLLIGPVTPTDRGNVTELLPRSTSALVPAGARIAYVTVTFTRPGGQGYNDGYADNIALSLRDETPPAVHTTAVDGVTTNAATVRGTVDDFGLATTYHVEYGPSTAYGQRTPDAGLPAGSGPQAVTAALTGLTDATSYHARVVADGPVGSVAGEDMAFQTASAAPAPPAPGTASGLPSPLDFTWLPHTDVLIAGAPAGGVQFLATKAPGVQYAWDFDAQPTGDLHPDPAATGDSPRHGFTADGAHDNGRVAGATGDRRRVYLVRLRATAPNGDVGEVSHRLVVMPNTPPSIDFVVRRETTGVNDAVTLVPQVTDPDQTPRTGDVIDHLEWTLDTPAPGGTALPDSRVLCAADGTGCRAGDGGTPLGSWFAQAPGGGISVNFFARALAAHFLAPLAAVDLDTLPVTGPSGDPLYTGLVVQQDQGRRLFVPHDPRATFLYDNATLLQQSSFNLAAGEATGAQLAGSSLLRTLGPLSKVKKELTPYAQYLQLARIRPREITLTAVDSTGARTSVTHSLPLTPDAAPNLEAQYVDRSPAGRFQPVSGKLLVKAHRHGLRAATSLTLDHPLTTQDELAFDASATVDPEGKLAWYVLEVGQPLDRAGLNVCRLQAGPVIGPTGKPSLDPGPDGYRPGEIFTQGLPGGTGPGTPIGAIGSLPIKGQNPRGLQRVGVRATASALPTLTSLLGTVPLVHPCGPFAARTVVPGSFKVMPSAAARPVRTVLAPALLQRRTGLEFDTTALVTRNPQDLRFRIPKEGRYSVSVAAYDASGQGAIQRTDGFDIKAPDAHCSNVSGERLHLKANADLGLDKHILGFGGLCMDLGGNHSLFWTTHDMDINGVTLRPAPGAALFVDARTASARVLSTTAPEPDLATLSAAGEDALASHIGAVSVVVDGDPIAGFPHFDDATAKRWIQGQNGRQPRLLATARYKGSPVARPAAGALAAAADAAFNVRFEAESGRTTTHFAIVLPSAFSRHDENTTPTADITRTGIDEPRATILTTNTYADIARARHLRSARARAAQINVAGRIDLSGTTLGPVSITKGNISFDAASSSFAANIDEAYLNIPAPQRASFHLVIADGELKSAAGSVGTNIPVFAGVFLTNLRFSLVTDPLTMSGGASFSALAGVLSGDVDLTVRPSPFFIRLQGSIAVAGLQVGDAFVQYDAAKQNTLTFHGQLGHDFGPVSLEVGLDGGISFDTGDFFVQGNGHACLFICLDVKALVSNIALAACGSIDFGITEVSAGFAYRFADGLKLFAGCDLDPYKPAVFKTRAGPRADLGVGGVVPVPAGVQQVGLRFVGAPGEAAAPDITITGPDGQVYTTAASPGDYVFSPPSAVNLAGGGTAKTPSALIDQDPVDHVTTFLIVNPAGGDYRVTLDPGQAPLRSSEVTVGAHLPDDALTADVTSATLTAGGATIHGVRYAAAGGASSAALKLQRVPAKLVSGLRRLPVLERRRLQGTVISVPAGLTGKLTLLDVDDRGTSVLNTVQLTGVAAKVPVVFAPSDAPGAHQLQAFLTHEDGVPRAVALVDRFTAPALTQPSAPALSLRRDGAGVTVLDVTPGTAGSLSSPATAFDLVASSSSGRRIERLVDTRDATPLGGGRFRVRLGRFTSAETVKVAGRMVYGDVAGRSASRTLLVGRRR